MPGLLDFLNTPEGAGLLSGVASYAANARRGTPINNIGRGFAGGMAGYQGAKDQITKDGDTALTQRYKQLQMDQITQTLAKQKAELDWKSGFPAALAPTLTGTTQEGQQLADQQAGFGADGVKSLAESAQYAGQDAPLGVNYGMDKNAVQQYMMQPGSPYAQKIIENTLIPKAPKWNVTERYNAQTGMPEKVLMDENNPNDIRPFGGAQADTIVADNTGGGLSYRGSHSVTPLGQLQKTASPDSLLSAQTTMRGQNMTSNSAAESRRTTIDAAKIKAQATQQLTPKLTEDQGKATSWLVQAENAYGNMNGAMKRTPSAAHPGINDVIGSLPMLGPLANSMRSPDRQQFMQGASSLSEALLRAATGAGVNKDEATQKIQELTPVFGESDATTKQKMAAIPLYIEALKIRAGPGAQQVPGVFDRAGSPPAQAQSTKATHSEASYIQQRRAQGIPDAQIAQELTGRANPAPTTHPNFPGFSIVK